MKKILFSALLLSALACAKKDNNAQNTAQQPTSAAIETVNEDSKRLSNEQKTKLLQGNWEILDEQTRVATILQVKGNQMATSEQIDNEYGWDTFSFVGADSDSLLTSNAVLNTTTKYKIVELNEHLFITLTEDGIRNEWKRSH